eukprot:3068944-Pyramimonas_sp.AAC.1
MPRQGQGPWVQAFAHEPHCQFPVPLARLVRGCRAPFAHRDRDDLRACPRNEELDALAVPDLGIAAIPAAGLDEPFPIVRIESTDVSGEVGADVR